MSRNPLWPLAPLQGVGDRGGVGGDWEKKAGIELFLDWSPAEASVWPFALAFECILSPKRVVYFFCFYLLFYFLSLHSRICLLAT